MTLFEISAAIVMLVLTVTLLALFLRMKRAASWSRLTRMMTRLGLDPLGEADSRQLTAIMNDVRKRCSRCPSEALCERWLAGEVGGDNLFCPNAYKFGTIGEKERLTV